MWPISKQQSWLCCFYLEPPHFTYKSPCPLIVRESQPLGIRLLPFFLHLWSPDSEIKQTFPFYQLYLLIGFTGQAPGYLTFGHNLWLKHTANRDRVQVSRKRFQGSKNNLEIGFSSIQLLSRIWLLVIPWTVAHQASLSVTNSWGLLKLMSIELVIPSNHLILCCPLLLLLQSFPASGSFQMSQFFALSGYQVEIRWFSYFRLNAVKIEF